MADDRTLVAPPVAHSAPHAREVLRVWVADDEPHVVLRAGAWKDAAAWGLLLADLARHMARSHDPRARDGGAATLTRIRQFFDAELDAPTSDVTGGVVEP